MRRKSKIFILSGVLTAAALLGTACAPRQNPEAQQQTLSLPATTGTIQNVVTFVGNVTSGQTSALTWKTDGVIETVNVELGDYVEQGDILATLERGSLSAAVLNSEVPLIEAQEELDELKVSETAKASAYKDLKDKEAALSDAEKKQESLKYPNATVGDINYWSEQVTIYKQYYDEALQSLEDAASWKNSPDETYTNLYDQRRTAMLTALNKYAEVYNNYLYYSGTATQNDQDQVAADIDVAKSDYEKALKTFATYAEYPREKDIAAAEITLSNAEDTYNRRSIVADISGYVTVDKAREGDYVTKGSSAFQIDNTSKLYVPMDISELDVNEVYDGMKAVVTLDANTGKSYEGVVTTVSASGTDETYRVTFGTNVEILDPDDTVKVGMTAEVDLVMDEVTDALLVPLSAVTTEDGKAYVTVVNGETETKTQVTVGITTDTVAQITGGLYEGDRVKVDSINEKVLTAMGLTMQDLMGDAAPAAAPADGQAAPMEADIPTDESSDELMIK